MSVEFAISQICSSPTRTGASWWCISLLITKSIPRRRLYLMPKSTVRVGVAEASASGAMVRRRSGMTAVEGFADPTRSVAKRSVFRLLIVVRE